MVRRLPQPVLRVFISRGGVASASERYMVIQSTMSASSSRTALGTLGMVLLIWVTNSGMRVSLRSVWLRRWCTDMMYAVCTAAGSKVVLVVCGMVT